MSTNTPTPSAPQPPQDETLLEAFASICTVLVVGLFIINFVFQNFEIPSGSMEKTLLIGDHVFVDRITFAPKTSFFPLIPYRDPKVGDIIVFIKPNEPDLYLVKRVVGLPGDRIHLTGGILYRNGQRVNEPQISVAGIGDHDGFSYSPYRDDFPTVDPSLESQVTATWATELPHHIVNGELVVPPGVVFAMGDNRVESLDGRYWGFVPRQNIIGRPLFIYWSFITPDTQMYVTDMKGRAAWAFHTITHFISDTRWSREFRPVR
jgi:signal peptidase I